MADNEIIPQIVEGQVVARSALKTIGFVFMWAFGFLFGCFLLWIWIDPKIHQLTWWGYTLCVLALVISPAMAAYNVWLLKVRRRIVIGDDRLQVVQRVSGEDAVVLQIPFANIESIKYEATSTERRIGIDLVDLNDAATYSRSKFEFQTNKNTDGRHYCIKGGYRMNLHQMDGLLQDAIDRWRK